MAVCCNLAVNNVGMCDGTGSPVPTSLCYFFVQRYLFVVFWVVLMNYNYLVVLVDLENENLPTIWKISRWFEGMENGECFGVGDLGSLCGARSQM